MAPACVNRIGALARGYAGRSVLELGTSRGFVAAVMAAYGCVVTTVDMADRGAAANLEGLGIKVVVADAARFLRRSSSKFAMIVVDFHDNSERIWNEIWPLVSQAIEPDGTLVLYNTHLWQMPEWREETGLRWLTGEPPQGWQTEVIPEPLPGMVICRHG